ncbi:NADH:flavin oxidoreductase [Sphingomonas sp. TZW2008]|uniref:NADH:flavin oxidoreductase n=1 Tax=Sphingomonas sp. TZW2008 TaxID=1917973 RepID=UPI000A267FA0|nr:NADH:flavin oxidoreductase [Sphingomonas sp. TZW2008]
MPVDTLFEPLALTRGPAMKNRFMLAPLTNQQSHPDGRLSDEEHRWLTMRATGGFAVTMTAAAHVQAVGQGFAGQIGAFGDEHLEGLTRLADTIRAEGSISSLQLHHAGNRSPAELVGTPVCPSDDPETGARGLTLAEVEQVRDDFIAAARRADQAGFDGVEVHGAHGYILAQFLSPEINRRDDRYGGSLENRARIVFEIVDGIRAACRPDFQIGVRLSPERFGLKLLEIRDVAARLLADGKIDFLDMSLWDAAKEPHEDEHKGRSLMSFFTDLPRGDVRLGAAGKIMSAADAAAAIDAGCDFVVIGRAAILRHDFPKRVAADPNYTSPPTPVSAQHLLDEGLSPLFVDYMRNWAGFVEPKAA